MERQDEMLSKLPKELRWVIYKFLDGLDLIRLSLCKKQFHNDIIISDKGKEEFELIIKKSKENIMDKKLLDALGETPPMVNMINKFRRSTPDSTMRKIKLLEKISEEKVKFDCRRKTAKSKHSSLPDFEKAKSIVIKHMGSEERERLAKSQEQEIKKMSIKR